MIDRPASNIVAICDLNAGRRAVYNDILRDAGRPAAVEYDAADFIKMLDTEKLDTLVVTTIDHTHDEFIVPAQYPPP